MKRQRGSSPRERATRLLQGGRRCLGVAADRDQPAPVRIAALTSGIEMLSYSLGFVALLPADEQRARALLLWAQGARSCMITALDAYLPDVEPREVEHAA